MLLFISPVFLLFFILPVLAGITLILVGSIWLIIKYTVRPSDEQYRGWLEERQLFLVNKAHQKAFLDLTQLESPRFVFKGSIRPNSLEAKNYKEVYKKDTRFGPHFSINTHLIIFLTKDNIIVFSSGINALDQMWSTSTVRYYYYEHVSGIQIADTVLEITTNQNIQAHFQAQVFYLLIDSGEQVGSDMVVSMGLEDANGTIAATESNDQLINRLISLLKDHKVSKLAARGSDFDNA